MLGSEQPKTDTIHRFAYVDALRGWAVMGVVATHVAVLTPDIPLAVKTYASFGGFGVALFFVVSAFTLTQSWHRRDKRVGAFYTRRFFRIAPAFWLAIALYSIFPWVNRSYWAPHGVDAWSVLLTASFLHGWHPETINTVVPGGWSIAVEFGFYFIFPLVMILAGSLVWAVAICAGLAIVTYLSDPLVLPALLRLYADSPRELVVTFQEFWLPDSLFVFFAGVATWFATTRIQLSKRQAAIETCVALAALAVLPWLRPDTVRFLAPIAFAVLAHALAFAGNRVLVNPLVCRIGVVSFSIYLWHFAVIMLFGAAGITGWHWHGLDYLLIYCLVLAVTFAISAVTYRMIEAPMIKAGNALIARWRPELKYQAGV